MFTGLVQRIGILQQASRKPGGLTLRIDLAGLPGPGPLLEFRLGDSIALAGVCCTVVALVGGAAEFVLSPETLARTYLGSLLAGDRLNLEGALRAGEPLGGHLVQGHVDGVGEVLAPIDPELGGDLLVRVPSALQKYCVEKGSITLDGVSLTIASTTGSDIRIAVIPHTAQVTTLGAKRAGEPVHVEVDVLAKYVERLLAR